MTLGLSNLPSRRRILATFFMASMMWPGLVSQGADTEAASLADTAQQAFDRGNFGQATTDWQKAAGLYRHQGNTNAEVRAAISLAGAHQSAGQQRMAVQVLEDALPRAAGTGDQSLVALVQWKLGAALVITRESTRADSFLNEALEYARANNDPSLTAAIWNDIGNAFAREQNYADALKAYEDSATLGRQATNASLVASALCNAAATSVQAGDFEQADGLNQQALAETDRLVPSRDKAFLLLTIGQTDRQLQLTNSQASQAATLRAYNAFQQALQIAEQRGDHATETYALGFLAQLYEQDGQTETALTLARRAAFAAQQTQMP
jgi:tetratricopeptide (TPR) repeat protein